MFILLSLFKLVMQNTAVMEYQQMNGDLVVTGFPQGDVSAYLFYDLLSFMN